MGIATSKQPLLSNKHCINNYDEMFESNNDDYKMHLMHCIFKEIWEANFRAPVDMALQLGAKVLDVGCGVGTWVNDMASDYRSSRFTGVDMQPLFPTVAKPFNVDFVQANVLNGLPFEDNTFDYVHCRFMIFDFMECQWNFIYREICRVLKPGGWIEIVDSELGFVSEGPYTRGVVEAICRKMKSKGINPLITSRHEILLRSTPNLQHVSHQQKNYEIGSNSGKISEQLSMNLRETFREFLLKFDGEMEIDSGLTNTRRPTSLGSAYENAHKLKDYGVHPEPYTKSGNAKHKRKSGWDGSRIYGRRDDISNKENTSHVATQETCKIIKNERSKTDSGIRSPKIILSKKSAIRKEKKVEMIIERISQEFDLYQSMILMHRFWARKANDTTTSNE